MLPDTAQETIEKFILDGDSRDEAVKRWEGIMRAKLPGIILNQIKEVAK